MRLRYPCLALAAVASLACLTPAVAATATTAAARPHHILVVHLDPATPRLEVEQRIVLPGGQTHHFVLDARFELQQVRLGTGKLSGTVGDGLRGFEIGPETREVLLRFVAEGAALTGPDRLVGLDGSFLHGAWYATNDELATFELTLHVPATQRAVAPGRLIEDHVRGDQRRVRIAAREPADGIAIFAGPYVVEEKRGPTACARTYLHPEVAALAPRYLERATHFVEHFSQRIGAFPFDCFSVVSSPLPVGLGFPGLTYVGVRVLPQPYMAESSLAHEVLHSWWGNGVFIRPEEGNWVEGLTTLLADHDLVEASDPAAAVELRARWLRDYALLPAAEDVPLQRFLGKRHSRSQPVGYSKAAFLFLMLRDRLGRTAFDAGLRCTWDRWRFERAGWSDLARCFEATADTPVVDFVHAWTHTAGAPAPRLLRASQAVEIAGQPIALTFAQPGAPLPLRVPVEFRLAGGGREVHHIDVVAPQQQVDVHLDERSVEAQIDPEYRVFRRLREAEIPPLLRAIAFAPEARLRLLDGDTEYAAAAQQLAASWFERPLEVAAAEARDGPQLIVGSAAAVAQELARHPAPPALPAGEGSARLWAARRRDGTPLVFLVADSAASIQAITAVLPHYGSRSHVVFEGSRAVSQGTWPVSGESVPVIDAE